MQVINFLSGKYGLGPINRSQIRILWIQFPA